MAFVVGRGKSCTAGLQNECWGKEYIVDEDEAKWTKTLGE